MTGSAEIEARMELNLGWSIAVAVPADVVLTPANEILIYLAYVMVFSIIILGIFGFFAIRSMIIRKIDILVSGSNHLKNRNFGHRLKITSNDESRDTANGYYESSTDDVEVTNPNPYTDYTDQSSVESVNSYDLQYQQYLEEMKQQMMSESNEPIGSIETEPSSEFTMSSNEMTYEPQQQSTEPTTAELVAQQEQHTQDIEESFLRTLSNEVNYKKFLNQSPYSLTDINVPLIIQRILDNIEDGQQKRNGKLKGLNKRLKRDRPRDERKTVVVLGTGWAAHAFIKLASTYDLRIVVVSPVNHFVFTPMLASAAVGTVEYRSMTEPIRVTNPCIDNYVEGRAIGIDVEGK